VRLRWARYKEIRSNYDDKYYQARKFKTKRKKCKETHEAIHTYMETTVWRDEEGRRLYELRVWRKNDLRPEMSDAEFERPTKIINISTNRERQYDRRDYEV